jgi:uncharacterized protein (DUF1330 family)
MPNIFACKQRLALPPDALEQVSARFADPRFDPGVAQWAEVFAHPDFANGEIIVIEIARLQPERKSTYDTFIQALRRNTEQVGGSIIAVTDILFPGTGDLESHMNFAGGTAWLARFPSRAAYIAMVLNPTYQQVAASRQAALEEVILLIAGSNTIPRAASLLFGPERPASVFKTPYLDGKSPTQLVDALLQIYPDGGADPSRAQLTRMTDYAGFATEPLYFLNLYAFAPGEAATQEASEHQEYNRQALATVRAHGGHPYLRATVEHALVTAIPWSLVVFVRWPSAAVFTDLRLTPAYIEAQRHRVQAAQTYGNFVTTKRHA